MSGWTDFRDKYLKPAAKATAAIATGGASLLVDGTAKDLWDDFTGKTATQQANAANAAEAEKNRQWQEYMSNTAYSRAVADLYNAGINTNAVGTLGSASTPNGAQATMQAEPSDMQAVLGLAQTVGNIAGGMSDLATASKTITENKYLPEKTKSQISNTNAATAMTSAQTNKINAETQKTNAEIQQIEQQINMLTTENKEKLVDYAVKYQNAKSELEKSKVREAFNKSAVGWGLNMLGNGIESILPILGKIHIGK